MWQFYGNSTLEGWHFRIAVPFNKTAQLTSFNGHHSEIFAAYSARTC
jgi:hypothetical protein